MLDLAGDFPYSPGSCEALCMTMMASGGPLEIREMKSEYLAMVGEVLVADFEVDPDAITGDARLYEDLDIDSIDAVDLMVRLKEITGKKVPPDKFKAVRTVGDVVEVLETL